MKNNRDENISHELYEKMLNKSTKKPYAIRFKGVRTAMIIFSIFGNIASIFFAYFFFTNLFTSSFVNITGKSVSIAIVVFLALFELLKRKIFDLFSQEYIKNSKSLFKKQMSGFILSTMILIAFSFFFSMNGAKKFMNKDQEIRLVKQETLNAEIDSISNDYLYTYILPIKDENKTYLSQKNEILSQRKEWVKKGWGTKTFDEDLDELDKQIQQNKDKITLYESKRDTAIVEYKQEYLSQYEKDKEQNKWNIIWFLVISGTIEIIILSGVYYVRHYEDASVKEYQKNVVNTPNYRKWKKTQDILEMIYETGVKMDEQISSTNELIELVRINDLDITKTEVENSFKIFGHLNIYKRVGNKRIIKMEYNDAYLALKNHFKIK
jgi:hypothetical protein